MGVTIKCFNDTDALIESGLADPMHDCMTAGLFVDFGGIQNITGVKTDLDKFAMGLESWAEEKGLHPVHCQKSDMYIVALRDGKPIGSATLCWENDAGTLGMRLGNVFVIPTERRKGVGEMLVKYALECGKAQEKVKWVGLSVVADNEGAIALYRKLGFLPVRVNMMRPLEQGNAV